MFCEKCGTKLLEGSMFCMNCGAKAIAGEAVQETAVQETAVQETAVSADTLIEAESAAVEKETAKIPDVQPVQQQEAVQYDLPGEEPAPVKNVTAPAKVSVQAPQPIPVQSATTQGIQQTAAPKNLQQPAAPSNLRQPAAPSNFMQPDASAQQAETALKPEKIKPLQTWKFVGMFIITAIPVVNLIMVLVWSFSSGFNKNTKSFARAMLILWIVGLVLLIITTIFYWTLIQNIWSSISSGTAGFPPVY